MSYYATITVKPEVKRFGTLEQYMDYKPSKRHEAEYISYRKKLEEGEDWKWRGFKGPGNLTKMLNDEISSGWQDGAKLINDTRGKILGASVQAPASRRLKMDHGHVTGFNPHVPSMMAGLPSAYSQWSHKPSISAVRIVCELGANCDKTPAELVWKGASALVIADLLQEAGYAVEIWGCWTVGGFEGKEGCFVGAFLAKPADSQPIPDLLASTLVSPRFFRGHVIPSLQVSEQNFSYWSYGAARTLNPALLAGTELEDLADGIYIGHVYDVQGAVKQVNDVVNKLNNGGK